MSVPLVWCWALIRTLTFSLILSVTSCSFHSCLPRSFPTRLSWRTTFAQFNFPLHNFFFSLSLFLSSASATALRSEGSARLRQPQGSSFRHSLPSSEVSDGHGDLTLPKPVARRLLKSVTTVHRDTASAMPPKQTNPPSSEVYYLYGARRRSLLHGRRYGAMCLWL